MNPRKKPAKGYGHGFFCRLRYNQGMNENLEALKQKLNQLNTKLSQLAESANEDIEIATAIQKLIFPNRLENIPGVRCVSRFIKGAEIGTEGFDIFRARTSDNHSWFIANQTASFGLSSVLMQTLIYLTTRLSLGQEKQLQPQDFYQILSESLGGAKKSAHFRLMVAKFHHNTLHWSGLSKGFAPFLVRKKSNQPNQWQQWIFEESFLKDIEQDPARFEPCLSTSTLQEQNPAHFDFTLQPGTRMAFLSPSWSNSKKWTEHKTKTEKLFKASRFLNENIGTEVDLIDDLNEMLIQAESHANQQNNKCDISAVVWDIDPTKLQLKTL